MVCFGTSKLLDERQRSTIGNGILLKGRLEILEFFKAENSSRMDLSEVLHMRIYFDMRNRARVKLKERIFCHFAVLKRRKFEILLLIGKTDFSGSLDLEPLIFRMWPKAIGEPFLF